VSRSREGAKGARSRSRLVRRQKLESDGGFVNWPSPMPGLQVRESSLNNSGSAANGRARSERRSRQKKLDPLNERKFFQIRSASSVARLDTGVKIAS